MKLKALSVEGLRGAPVVWEVPLREKSVSILGPNGHGKSTLADGLEYLTTGELLEFKRADYGLGAAINLDHGGPAKVSVTLADGSTRERRLEGAAPGELTDGNGNAVPIDAMPILRHRTLARFMFKTPGEKRDELLPILGMEALLDVRSEIKKASNSARRRVNAKEETLERTAAELADAAKGGNPIDFAEELRKAAGVELPIQSAQDLLSLDLEITPGATRVIGWTQLVEAVEGARESLVDDPTDDWNQLIQDRAKAQSSGAQELVRIGLDLLQEWPDEKCPLCLLDFERADLRVQLEKRAVHLEEATQEVKEARERISAYKNQVQTMHRSIAALLEVEPEGGWPHLESLSNYEANLRNHLKDLDAAVAGSVAMPRFDQPDFAPILADLRGRAEDQAKHAEGPSLARLERLRSSFVRNHETNAELDAARVASARVDRLREVSREEIEAAVDAEIREISELTARYFGRLIRNDRYSDLELKYDPRWEGGIEFQLVYRRGDVIRPPQRVVSESQLNALGIALFLARCKHESNSWEAMVMDDIVNSFDSDHRSTLARLLADEFADYQVIFLTHDRSFERHLTEVLPGWDNLKITSWSPDTGPSLSSAEPIKRLENLLDDGISVDLLGTPARVALESTLERIASKLEVPIYYDRAQRYTALTYFSAISNHLASKNSQIADDPRLSTVGTANYLTTLAAHFRPDDPLPTEPELRQMVDDIRALDAAFRCPSCEKAVWAHREGQPGARSWRCDCNGLTI